MLNIKKVLYTPVTVGYEHLYISKILFGENYRETVHLFSIFLNMKKVKI